MRPLSPLMQKAVELVAQRENQQDPDRDPLLELFQQSQKSIAESVSHPG